MTDANDGVMLQVDVPKMLATIEMLKVQFPIGSPCNIQLDFGDGATDEEIEAMQDRLSHGLALTALYGGLIAVFTGGMAVQQEMQRQAEFEADMLRQMQAE